MGCRDVVRLRAPLLRSPADPGTQCPGRTLHISALVASRLCRIFLINKYVVQALLGPKRGLRRTVASGHYVAIISMSKVGNSPWRLILLVNLQTTSVART